ncbi:hypothetical protein ACP70R_016952 [Stipagrostis hirtigluma subsp. patula]
MAGPGRDERMVSLEKECGDISASQEELLSRSSFLGGDQVDMASSQAASFVGGGREKVELECGDISASQEELLAGSSFLGGGGGEEEAEVFSTPPLTQEDQQQQEEEDEDAMSMRSLPTSQPSPWADAPKSKLSTPRKPRVCTRKVRGARIRTPTPSPVRSTTPTTTGSGVAVDPLCRAVLMIPTKTSTDTPAASDILALARDRGIF